MADIQKAIVVSGVHTNIINTATGKSENYKEVLTWYDGSTMTNAKCDGDLYRRKGTKFLRKVIDKDGQLFLEKDIMAQMRALSAYEVLLLKAGVVKGVRLSGYYAKGDTPAPIDYFLSTTTDVDDGGSVIDVTGGKLEHKFVGEIDLSYFGVINGFDDGTRLNEVIEFFPKFFNIKYVIKEVLDISQRILILNPVNFSSFKVRTVAQFDTRSIEIQSSNVIINNFYFDGNELNNYCTFINGKNVIIEGIEVFDLKETDGVNGIATRGFHVHTLCENVHLRNGSIRNIIPVENGISGDEQGSARAITMRGVYNCSIENISTDNIQGFEDGDVFHIQSVLDEVTQEWSKIDVTVKNCRLYNIYKTGVKIQASGVTCVGNEISSNWTSEVTTHAGIRDYGTGNILDSNIIKLNRAKACIIGGAQGFYDDATITNNYMLINQNGEWTSTAASGNRIGTLYLERPVRNLKFNNNTLIGFGNIECTAAQQISDSTFNGNVFRNSGINLNYASDVSNKIENTELNNNSFYYSNATSGDSSVVRLRNPNGVVALNNSFYNVNRPISVLGDVGSNKTKIKINSIGNLQPVAISLNGVTSGITNVDIYSDRSVSLDNSTNIGLSNVSNLDANAIDGTKTLLTTSLVNGPVGVNLGILVNYSFGSTAGFQWLLGYNTSDAVYYRRKASGVFSSWVSLHQGATITVKGLVNQSAAIIDSSVADATDLDTAIALVNDLKAKLNAILASERASGQRAN